MERRKFIRQSLAYSGGAFFLNGIAFNTMQANSLQTSAAISKNDRVMVIIQMHGGNDGLNAVIPVSQYSSYYNLRPNLAISDTGQRKFLPLDSGLSTEKQIGLHPDMKGFKELYDRGELAILQNVGYENMNGSHFKGRDIWFGGVGAEDNISSGWMGRYLQLEYERTGKKFPDDFPTIPPDDSMYFPLGLEFSNEVSLGFNTAATVPAAISIPNPGTFFDLVSDLTGYNDEIKVDPRGIPTPTMKPTLYGKELEWILEIEQGTDKYAKKIQEAYKLGDATKTSVVYPNRYPLAAPSGSLYNALGSNLQIVSKLISGGCTTKIYLIRIGGFDTHVNQVETYDNSLGSHAALMYHVSASMKAFQDDLKARGIADKVVTVTMSEFGRRAESNNSYGSDHGTVAPLFVTGTKINPGIIGANTDLSKVKANGGNLSDKKEDVIDFKVIFSTILQDWFELENSNISTVFPALATSATSAWGEPDIYDKVPLFGNRTNLDSFMVKNIDFKAFPNPATEFCTIQVSLIKSQKIELLLLDTKGNRLLVLFNGNLVAGKHEFPLDLSQLPKGLYFYTLLSNSFTQTKKLIKN
ncbi:MAG: DUF1501 domain-containing protein [Bacteroidetes bacterium]|nr:MAG: DUF1501 domain-containing protein [Bacteroidota bacterium]